MEELYSSRFHETWRNTIPPGFMKPWGIQFLHVSWIIKESYFFIEPQLFVFHKDHRNFEISIQTSFSLLTKKFLNPSGHPSKYWLGSQLLNFLIDASHSCDIAICSCLEVVDKLFLIYVRYAVFPLIFELLWRELCRAESLSSWAAGRIVFSVGWRRHWERRDQRPS